MNPAHIRLLIACGCNAAELAAYYEVPEGLAQIWIDEAVK